MARPIFMRYPGELVDANPYLLLHGSGALRISHAEFEMVQTSIKCPPTRMSSARA